MGFQLGQTPLIGTKKTYCVLIYIFLYVLYMEPIKVKVLINSSNIQENNIKYFIIKKQVKSQQNDQS